MVKTIKTLTIDSKGKQLDFTLLFIVLLLLCIGMIVLSSASSYYALTEFNNSSYYLTRQIAFAVVGIAIMIIVSKIDYKVYTKFGYMIYFLGIGLMLMVFIPGIGGTVNGANRWLNLGFTRFQPSEIMKLSLIIGLTTYIEKNGSKLKQLKGYIVPAGMIALVCVIMYFQSHMSGMIVMLVIGATIIFVNGIKIKKSYIILAIIAVVVIAAIFLMTDGYRLERVTSFMNSEEDTRGSNWQPVQSLYAIGTGGFFGRGLGQSRQKYLWLPEAQNDFIFSVCAEEFGFFGCTVVLALYALFIARGFTIAMKSKNKHGMLITSSIIAMFAFQILVNVAVVTVSIPTTGMPLPFFSAGGTSLVINLAAVGLVLNISRQGK